MTRDLSLGKKVLFASILVTLSIAVALGGTEMVLRIIGYGESTRFARLAKTSTGESMWRENRWFTAPYFSRDLVRRPFPFRLPEKKGRGAYRIFVLGSSAAMGDPEPSFSVARVVETMLREAYPQLRFEVVNAAVTAINSHVVRQIAEDCAALEPDLFIVYEGNNEVIGPFGPSGVFAPFFRSTSLIRLTVWLKSTRTGQLFSETIGKLRGQAGVPAEWGGMQMFLKQQITVDDPRLETVQRHFADNLRAIAETARDAGAGSLVCTILTNQRDFAPFLSSHRKGLTNEQQSRWEAHIAAADKATAANDLDSAEAEFRAALKIDDQRADLAFRLGRLLLQKEENTEGRALLQRAADLDTLRFRTDSKLNNVIRDIATDKSSGAELVDLESILSSRSQHGLAGDELLYEHVHLTLRGAYEVARELLPRIGGDLARRGLSADRNPKILDYGEVRWRLGFTAHEQAMIAIELVNRFKAPPFTGQVDHANRLASWQRRADAATALLAREDALPALREIYQRALAHAPDDWVLARNAGAMFVARRLPTEARPLLEQVIAMIDDDIDTLVALGWAYRGLGDNSQSDAAFARARLLEPRYPGLPSSSAAAGE